MKGTGTGTGTGKDASSPPRDLRPNGDHPRASGHAPEQPSSLLAQPCRTGSRNARPIALPPTSILRRVDREANESSEKHAFFAESTRASGDRLSRSTEKPQSPTRSRGALGEFRRRVFVRTSPAQGLRRAISGDGDRRDRPGRAARSRPGRARRRSCCRRSGTPRSCHPAAAAPRW